MAKKINLSRFGGAELTESVILPVDAENGRFVTVVGAVEDNREILRCIDGADYSQGQVLLLATNELNYTTYENNPVNRGDNYLSANQPGRAFNLYNGNRVGYPAAAFTGGTPARGKYVVPTGPGTARGLDVEIVDAMPTEPNRIYGLIVGTEMDYTHGEFYIVRFAYSA